MGLRQYSSDQPFFDKIPAFSHMALDNGSTEVSSKLQRSVTTSSPTRPKRAFSLKKKKQKKHSSTNYFVVQSIYGTETPSASLRLDDPRSSLLLYRRVQA